MSRKSLRRDRLKGVLAEDRGAALVEFALALLFLFFIFIFFIQITKIVLAHERLSFATFAASRVYAVHGSAEAARVAHAIESDINVQLNGEFIGLAKKFYIPINFRDIYDFDGTNFGISDTVQTFIEQDRGGDN